MSLSVQSISASYSEKIVFEDVSFEVKPGEILAVFGPNGSGKSTIIKALAGLVPQFKGSIILKTMDLSQSKLGYVPQDFRQSFFPWADLYGNIALARSEFFNRRHESNAFTDDIVEQLSIDIDFNLYPHQCSGGMLQQAAIARALATDPDIILADEPFSALDYAIAKTLRYNLKKEIVKRSIPMIVVLHDFQDILEIADHVLVIPSMPFSSNSDSDYELVEKIINLKKQKQLQSGEHSFVGFAKKMLLGNA